MNTRQLLKKLADLAELSDIWENPTADKIYLYEFGGWLINDSSKPREQREWILPTNTKSFSFIEAWKHRTTQEAFKSRVFLVGQSLVNTVDPEFKYRPSLKRRARSFDDLFSEIIGTTPNYIHFYETVAAICLKMNVEL